MANPSDTEAPAQSTTPSKRPFLPSIPDRWIGAVALGLPALLLFSRLAKGGIWDPFELNVADLARRVAVNVYGARGLELAGGDNTLPRLGDLGRGELPFDSIAVGFRLFGLHEWAGRLPLAVWGLAGVAALYLFVSRLVDKRAGLFASLILATMPLYFIQARTMLGDIVTMAAITIAFSGLGLATFDRTVEGAPASAKRTRILALVAGLAGLAAGFMTRGALMGVALPALSIGLTWGIIGSSSRSELDRTGDLVGAGALVVGMIAAFLGVRAFFNATPSEYSPLLGASIATQGKFPTFDFVIHYLGHSLFPWSAFIPFAAGRLFRAPPPRSDAAGGEAAADVRESHARLALLVGSAVAFGIYALLAPRTGHLAFGAPALLAGIAAVAIRDFERSAPPSRAIAVGVAVLMALFLRDYIMFPEKGLSAFAINNGTFPDSFKDQAGQLILLSTGLFVVLVFFAWLERDPELAPFRVEDYLAWPRGLMRAWDGNLAFGLAVLEVAFVAVAIVVYVGLHFLHSKQIVQLGVPSRMALLNAFWAAPLALFGLVWATMGVRDVFRWFFRATGISRGLATIGAGVLVGALLSFVYYPALAAQLSPREVFEAYARLHHNGEPLALLGVGGRSASYYSGGDVKTLTDVPSAYSWLPGSTERRWLVVRNEDLGRLNSTFRARPGKRQNLPVLDARSSQILLVSNLLEPGEVNSSPYDQYVLDAEPHPPNVVEVNFQDQLLGLGWEVTDSSGQRVDYVVPARKYHFRLFYKVLAPIAGEWETFIHIDGFHRRYNGDHKTLDGKYPFSLWQVGDYIVDEHEFSLEPNFTPGNYNVFYGLFVGESRMKVKTGKHDDNRVDGGFLRVQ